MNIYKAYHRPKQTYDWRRVLIGTSSPQWCMRTPVPVPALSHTQRGKRAFCSASKCLDSFIHPHPSKSLRGPRMEARVLRAGAVVLMGASGSVPGNALQLSTDRTVPSSSPRPLPAQGQSAARWRTTQSRLQNVNALVRPPRAQHAQPRKFTCVIPTAPLRGSCRHDCWTAVHVSHVPRQSHVTHPTSHAHMLP